MTLPIGEYGIWVAAYAEPGPLSASTTLFGLFDAADEAFDLSLRYCRGAVGDTSNVRVAVPREWLSAQLGQLDTIATAASAEGRRTAAGLAIWVVRKETLHWELEAYPFSEYEGQSQTRPDPRIFFMADLALARDDNSVRKFANAVVPLLMRDRRIWYAHINAAPRTHVPHPAFYSGMLGGVAPEHRLTWERLVEQDRWAFHQRGRCDKVRNVFWGNIFGSEFASRLRATGFDERMAWLRESHPWYPTTLYNEEAGSMAVLLSDSPVWFARKRDSGFNAHSGEVRGAGVLCEVLSRAGML